MSEAKPKPTPITGVPGGTLEAITPVKVQATIGPDGTVTDGHHRLRAARRMGARVVDIDGKLFDISSWPINVDEGFTPGPVTRSCFAIYSEGRDQMAHTGNNGWPPSRSNESEANARRFAAAWNAVCSARLTTDALEDGVVLDLFNSLREIVQYDGAADSPMDDSYVMNRARDAVSKAFGMLPLSPAGPWPWHPLQPIELDDSGVARFRRNKIVRFLLDQGPFDMNKLAIMEFSDADRMQFVMLIGYSVSGFGELSYAQADVIDRADRIVETLVEDKDRE